MIDIFISHAAEDGQRVRELKRALEGFGWTVSCSDHGLKSRPWLQSVDEKLDQARCLVVAWSKHSTKSARVLKEADYGRSAKILTPVSLDQATPPLRFSIIKTHSLLSDRNPTETAAVLEELKTDISRMLSRARTGESKPITDIATTQPRRTPQPNRHFSMRPAPDGTPATPKSRLGNARLALFRLSVFVLMFLGGWFVWEQYTDVLEQRQHITDDGIVAKPPAPQLLGSEQNPGPEPRSEDGASRPADRPGAAMSKVYLTAKESNGIPANLPSVQFTCTDKIFAVIEVAGLARKQHELMAIWRDPHGKEREHTRYPFFSTGGPNRIWVWLKLHRPPEASLVRFVNPSAGMEEFIGEWELRITLDGKTINKQNFNILC